MRSMTRINLLLLCTFLGLTARADKITDLCAAAGKGDLAQVTALLTETPTLVSSRGNNQWTPLFFAARAGQKEVVIYLLDHGAEVNATDNTGATPLHVAAENGHPQTIDTLLNRGASIDLKDHNAQTPLFVAISGSKPTTIKTLLEHGANPNISIDAYFKTPLLAAIDTHKPQIVGWLLDKGAEVNAHDENGMTAMYYAIERGEADMALMLITKGADITITPHDRPTFLHTARQHPHPAFIRALVQHGAKDATRYLADVAMPAPLLVGTKVLLPLAYLSDWLGADSKTTAGTTTVKLGTASFTFSTGSSTAVAGGEAMELPVPPATRDGLVYVPLNLLVKGLRLTYGRDYRTEEITLTHPLTGEKLTFAVKDPAPATRSAAKTAGAHPIIDIQVPRLVGGVLDGKLLAAEKISAKVKNKETYKLYGVTHYLGRLDAAWQENEDPVAAFAVTLSPELTSTNGMLAINSEWNALPRTPRLESSRAQIYLDAVDAVLRKHGLQGAKVNITQIVRADLDGDGNDEVLISAESPQYIIDGSDIIGVKKNDYSLVLLRKTSNGVMSTIELAGEYYPKRDSKQYSSQYSLAGVLDVDGDGVQEIEINAGAYSGGSTAIYRLRGDKVVRLLSAEWAMEEGD